MKIYSDGSYNSALFINSNPVKVGVFELALTTTAEIEAWNTKYSGSYARASSTNVFDFQPIIKTAGTNIAALYGAREVTNLCLRSQDITSGIWGTSTVNKNSATEFTATAANGLIYTNITTEDSHEYVFSFTAHVASGQLTGYRFRRVGSESGNTFTMPILTRIPEKYSIKSLGKSGGGAVLFGVIDSNASNWAKVTVTDFQVEDVTGQTLQSPSDSIVTTSAVVTKYFNNENLNIVTSTNDELVKTRIIGNYSKGGCVIGDSRIAFSYAFSYILNDVLDETVTNAGIPTNTLAEIETRFIADADPANQSFIIISGGVNSLVQVGMTLNIMQTSIINMVASCVTNSCIPMFTNIAPFGNYASWSESKQTLLESYNSWLASYCITNGYKLFDVYTLFGDSTTPKNMDTEYTVDDLHWNDFGSRVLYEELIDPYFRVTATATSIPLENTIGLSNSPSKTNVVTKIPSRDFTDVAWNPVNGSVTAGDVVLIDGTTVADKNTFTASAANATLILDPYVSASGVHAGGVFIKRKTGTGAIEVTMDGGSTWVAVTTDILTTGWFCAQTTLPTVTDPEFGIRLVVDTDAVYLDWCQVDDGAAFVNSHSPITGGATLALADLHCSSTGLITASKGSIYLEYQALPDWSEYVNDTVILGNGDCEIRAEALTSGISFNDGTNDTVGYAGTPSGVIKAVIRWEGTSVYITTINGTTTGTYAGNFGDGTIYFGRNSTGNAFPGVLIDYKFWEDKVITEAEADELVI